MTGLVMVLVSMLGLGIVTAQSTATATRSFDSATVAAGGQVEVTINVSNYGGFGRVTETLPMGFTYVSSSLEDFQVTPSGQEVRFTLQGESSFTYTVTASSMAGSHSFSGQLRDGQRNNVDVGGASSVTVQAAQTSGASASRALSSATVAAGAELTVTITASNYGGFGRVTETLPTGFTYVRSSLDSFQVTPSGQNVGFTLQGESSFTYVVTASSTAGSYSFSGQLRDSQRATQAVGGASSVTVTGGAAASASRALSTSTVAAGAEVTVTISVANYGGFGRLTETLPAGFTYVRSSLDTFQVSTSGQTASFTLQGESSFTYVVTASGTAGAYSFSGQLSDSQRASHNVTGESNITVQGQAAPASRSFSPSTAAPSGSVTVRIAVSNYGGFGRLTETLPAGFDYVSSSLDSFQVSRSGQTVSFTLQGETSFSYVVTAPAAASTYTFSGTLRDSNRVETSVGGVSSLQVGAAPPPPSVPTPVPPPAATAVPPVGANVRPAFDGGIVQERSIAEGADEGANVGDPVTATDANGDEVTYSFLPGNDEGLFEIDGSTGQITVGEGTELDFESKSSYVVRVRASDPLGAADHGTVTINVTDVDEDATPTPEPTTAPEPTATPAPTATRQPATATPVPTATMPAPTATAAPTATTPPPTATTAPTATPEPEPTMAPPTATTAPTAMPEPTATPEPEPTAAPTPAPTATTAPPAPTATTAPVEPEEEPGFPVVIILLIIVAIVVVAVIFFVVRRR